MNAILSKDFFRVSPLFVLVFGIAFFRREFCQIHFGNFFITEILLVLFLLLNLKQLNRLVAVVISRKAWPIFIMGLFLVIGVFRLAGDFLTNDRADFLKSIARTGQHGLVFFYPFVGLLVGFFMQTSSRKGLAWMGITVLISAGLYQLPGYQRLNISLGPLFAFFVTWFFYKRIGEGKRFWILEGVWEGVGFFFLYFLAFLPFWWMFLDTTQRTTLLLLTVILIQTPVLMRKKGMPWAPVFFVVAFPFIFFVLGLNLVFWLNERVDLGPYLNPSFGFLSQKDSAPVDEGGVSGLGDIGEDQTDKAAVTPLGGTASSNGKSKKSAMDALIHGDDHVDGVEKQAIQGRFRKFCWNQAIQQWKSSPWFGVGFVTEVPDMLSARQKNENGWLPNQKAVSGPHNSYLTILARTGFLGFALFASGFFLLGFQLLGKARKLDTFETLLAFTVFITGAIHAVFNVGLENPQSSLLMWLFAGALLAWVPKDSDLKA